MDALLLRPVPSIHPPAATSPLAIRFKLAKSKPEQLNNTTLGSVSRALRSVRSAVLGLWDGEPESAREARRKIEERRQILAFRMKNADTLKQWETAARELDDIEGNNLWKLDPSTADYHPELIEDRLRELDEARTSGDVRAMMYLIRTTLSRDLGGMGNVDLYRHSYVGTKKLIEHYVDVAIKTIEALVDRSKLALPEAMGDKDLLDGVLCARQSFGRSALLLSGGGTFGMTHTGVLKALFEVNLLPRIISGASAGSIVCAVLCTRTDEEVPALIREFPYGDLDVFEEKGKPDGLLEHMLRLLTEGSWSDIKHLTRVMQGLLGDITFQEAYNRTRRILNICVSTASIYEMPRLLNYITAPNVMIWSAVAASCSVPLVFTAAGLLVKNPVTGEHSHWAPTPQRWIDGSVDNDLPMTRLAEMFNVNHFIVSQVNPHVVPFLSRDDQLHPTPGSRRRDWPNLAPASAPGQQPPLADWVYTVTSLARDEALHRLHFLTELGVFPNLATKLHTMLSQKYSGDINILPDIPLQDLSRLLRNPDSDFMSRCSLAGERATWPKLSRIRDRLAIELALDRAVHRLRARVVFSASQVDLRRLAAAGELRLPPQGARPLADDAGGPAAAAAAVGDLGREGGLGEEEGPTGRRRSGSSIQLMVHRRRLLMLDGGALTDDETEEEERLEMLARCGPTTAAPLAPAARRPRLRRQAKSHFDMPYISRPLVSADGSGGLAGQEAASDFDFSKPLTPPAGGPADAATAAADSSGPDEDPEREADGTWASPSMGQQVLTSTTEPGTSDVHSSDGDVEFRSDESVSEPDPEDGFWLGRRAEPAAAADTTSGKNTTEPPSPSGPGVSQWD